MESAASRRFARLLANRDRRSQWRSFRGRGFHQCGAQDCRDHLRIGEGPDIASERHRDARPAQRGDCRAASVRHYGERGPRLECGGLPPLSRRQLAAGGRGKPRPSERCQGTALQITARPFRRSRASRSSIRRVSRRRWIRRLSGFFRMRHLPLRCRAR